MPLYEVLLLREDEHELRLTDRSLRIGQTLPIGEERWLVQSEELPGRTDASARYICIRCDDTK